jgi:hypothetical protein
MSKVYFAIGCVSQVINGITVLELENEPLDMKAVQSMADHIKLVFKQLEPGTVDLIVDEMIDKNERALFAKMLVAVPEPNHSRTYDQELRETVYSEYDRRFPKEVSK